MEKYTSPTFLAHTLSLSSNRMDRSQLEENLGRCLRIIQKVSSTSKSKFKDVEVWRENTNILESYIYFILHELVSRFKDYKVSKDLKRHLSDEERSLIDDLDNYSFIKIEKD